MAVKCKIDANMLKSDSCAYSLPEVVELWIANFEDVVSTAFGTTEGTQNSINSIVMKETDGVTAQFYQIQINKNSGSFTDNLAVGSTNNKYRVHTVTFSVDRAIADSLPGEIDAFSLGKYIVVVYTASGDYLMLGRLTGMEAAESDNVSFAGGSDQSGLTVTWTANVTESAVPLTAAAVAIVKGTN